MAISNGVNTDIIKKVGLGVAIWLVLILGFHSLGALFHKDAVVYIMGGAKNLFIALFMTLIVFFLSYAAPQKIFAKSEKGQLWKIFLFQTIIIAVLLVLGYLVAFRLVFGFNIWDVKIMLVGAFKQAVYTRVIGLLLGGFAAGACGLLGSKKLKPLSKDAK